MLGLSCSFVLRLARVLSPLVRFVLQLIDAHPLCWCFFFLFFCVVLVTDARLTFASFFPPITCYVRGCCVLVFVVVVFLAAFIFLVARGCVFSCLHHSSCPARVLFGWQEKPAAPSALQAAPHPGTNRASRTASAPLPQPPHPPLPYLAPRPRAVPFMRTRAESGPETLWPSS